MDEFDFNTAYRVLEDGKIIPTHDGGLAKQQPPTQTFSQALDWFLEQTGLEDAGFTNESPEQLSERIVKDCAELFSSYYLNPAEALYLLTGVTADSASYIFEWEEQRFFTMRPDFGLASILSNLNKRPVNQYEEKIQDQLYSYCEEIESIHRAITNGEISLNVKTKQAPFDKWILLFSKRGFDLSYLPEKYLPESISSSYRQKNQLKEQDSPPYLDQTNRYYSPELAVLVKAWLDLYHHKKVPLPPTIRNRDPLRQWLIKHYGGELDSLGINLTGTNIGGTGKTMSGDPYLLKILDPKSTKPLQKLREEQTKKKNTQGPTSL